MNIVNESGLGNLYILGCGTEYKCSQSSMLSYFWFFLHCVDNTIFMSNLKKFKYIDMFFYLLCIFLNSTWKSYYQHNAKKIKNKKAYSIVSYATVKWHEHHLSF
jgi:hypothetical protein